MFLGIDVGTQSVKVLLYDAEKRRIVAVQSAPLELLSHSDGTREQRAEWWIAALGECLSCISPTEKSQVKAIGVSGQQHGFVPLSAEGKVLAPVKLWNDTTTVSECAEITANYGGAALVRSEVGNDILPGYTASKIRGLKNQHPEVYAQLDTILLPHDYLNFYLTGERAMECGDASGTGLLDIRTRDWHAGMLLAVDDERDLAACLPPLVSSGEVMGRLRDSVASELGLPIAIPVAAGGGDNMMAALGTGNTQAGRLTVSLGTSGTLFAYSDVPVIDPEGQLAAFCSSTGGWLPLLCTMNCTVATELTRQLFGDEIEALERQVCQVAPGAAGVVTLPFFSGERTPNLPHGKGCILGLDDNNYTRGNLMRSAMESATFALRSGLDAFLRLGVEVNEIRLTGGGARSATWRQMVADIFARPVTVLANDEGAALGAALQALCMHTSVEPHILVESHLQRDESRCSQPNNDTADQYREYYGRYLSHVAQVAPLYQ
jgi:xylulokinase